MRRYRTAPLLSLGGRGPSANPTQSGAREGTLERGRRSAGTARGVAEGRRSDRLGGPQPPSPPCAAAGGVAEAGGDPPSLDERRWWRRRARVCIKALKETDPEAAWDRAALRHSLDGSLGSTGTLDLERALRSPLRLPEATNGARSAHVPAEPSRERLDAWLETWIRRDGVAWARSTRLHRAAVMDKWIAPAHRRRAPARPRPGAGARVAGGDARPRGARTRRPTAPCGCCRRRSGWRCGDGLIPANPCLGIKRLPHTPAPARPLSPYEAERLRAELPTLRDQVLWGLMAYAGLRPEEALALRWGDVGATLHVHRALHPRRAEGHQDRPGPQRGGDRPAGRRPGRVARAHRVGRARRSRLPEPRPGRPARRRAAPGRVPAPGQLAHPGLPAGDRARGTAWRHPLQRPRHLREPPDLRGPPADPGGRRPRARRHPDPLAPLRRRLPRRPSTLPGYRSSEAVRRPASGSVRSEMFPRCSHAACSKPLRTRSPRLRTASAGESLSRGNASTRGRIRTCDLWLRRPALYPLSYARESG